VKERPSTRSVRLPRAMDTKPHEALNMAIQVSDIRSLLVVSVPRQLFLRRLHLARHRHPQRRQSQRQRQPQRRHGDGAANHAHPQRPRHRHGPRGDSSARQVASQSLACSSIRRRTRPPRSSPMTNTTAINWSKTQSGYDPMVPRRRPSRPNSRHASSRQRRQRAKPVGRGAVRGRAGGAAIGRLQ